MKLHILVMGWITTPILGTAVAGNWTLPIVSAVVNTTSGQVIGHPARNRTGVAEYLGIPYAQPPLGALRFAPPLPYRSSAVLNASSYVGLEPDPLRESKVWLTSVPNQSPDCPANPAKPVLNFPNHTAQEPQIVAYFAGEAGTPQSEDCLTLNIWSKGAGRSCKPVLVWFYGGRKY